MLNKLYDLFNTVSVTAWIAVVYIIKAEWTFDDRLNPFILASILIAIIIVTSRLSLFLTKFLSEDNLVKCVEVEQADA